jgi:long-chain-fatty-acid--CoA ligase ACSBG
MLVRRMGDVKIDNEVLVSYLPLSHSAAQILDIFGPSLFGATVYFAQPDALKVSTRYFLR